MRVIALLIAPLLIAGCAHSDQPWEGDYAAHYQESPYQGHALGYNDRIFAGEDGRFYCQRRNGSLGLAVGIYQHINVRFNSPSWWRFLFNTTEHHSVHHSQDYEGSRSNYSGTWIIIDRMFGTCVDGEAELLGMEGGRRMSVGETMVYPFTEGWRSFKERFGRREPVAVPAE